MANSAALVTDAFPRRELGRALGINAMVVGAGLILGPILGGWLTGFGWRTGVLVQRADRDRRARSPPRCILVEQAQARERASRSTGWVRRSTSSALMGAHDGPRLRRHLRLDDVVGRRRARRVPRRRAALPLGRATRRRAAARPRASSAIRLFAMGNLTGLLNGDRPQRRPVPAGVLPPGRPRLRPGDRRAHARAARGRPARPVADQRRPRRPATARGSLATLGMVVTAVGLPGC